MDKGMKFDGDKLRFSLLPWQAVAEVVKVLEFGAKKYDVDNWQRVENAEARYWDAAIRHLVALRDGERIDPESGISHWAHAACGCLFGTWFAVTGGKEK